MESRTVKLRSPIEFGPKRIEELTFRPVTGKDLRGFRITPGLEIEAMLVLAGRLAGQVDAVIDQLTGEDLEEVLAIAADFLPGTRRTGGTPSGS